MSSTILSYIILASVVFFLLILFIISLKIVFSLKSEKEILQKKYEELKNQEINELEGVEENINETNKLKQKIDTGNGKSDFNACNDIMSDLSQKRKGDSRN